MLDALWCVIWYNVVFKVSLHYTLHYSILYNNLYVVACGCVYYHIVVYMVICAVVLSSSVYSGLWPYLVGHGAM